MNPFDERALEMALALKDRLGARVTAVSMGPPQATAVLREALARGAELCAPRWNGETYALSRVGTACGAVRLRSGPMGVREPDEDLPVAPHDVAAWLVPGLAFGRERTRVGYGGGWYDRLLAAAAAEARIVGVAFGFQVFDALAAESHDARVHELCLC